MIHADRRLPVDQVAGIKWDWLNKQLAARKPDFCDLVPVSLLLVTWNVNGTEPGDSLDILFRGITEAPRVIFIGLQEVFAADAAMDYLADAFTSDATDRPERWTTSLLLTLMKVFPTTKYILLDVVRLAGIQLLAVKREDAKEIKVEVVAKGTAPCGLMGVLGNKGGVAIRLRVGDSLVTVVNSHLAAHPEMVDRRNQDFREIRGRLLLPKAPLSPSGGDEMAADRALQLLRDSWAVNPNSLDDERGQLDECDTLFWLGDLNYRLDIDISRAKLLINEQRWEELQEVDQLRWEREAKRTFPDFIEPPIAFPPTYKYEGGTARLNENRAPAYCDRIMHRRGDPVEKAIFYSSLPEITQSDHKPVRALFTAHTSIIDPPRFERVFDEVVHSLDVWENALIPNTEVQLPVGGILDYGEVRFRMLQSRQFTFRNVGRTAAHFAFIAPPSIDTPFPDWMRASPSSGLLLPGHSVNIAVHLLIGPKDAFLFNQFADQIDRAILILHVAGGRDHFIPLSGTWHPTLFARPLSDTMTRTRRPDGSCLVRVPEPLGRLAKFIIDNDGLSCDSLLLASGDRHLLDQVIAAIDDGVELPAECRFPSGMLAVGEVILRWLEALPEPLLPSDFTTKHILVRSGNPERAVATELSDDAYIVVDYITSLFGPLPRTNRTVDPDALAYVLGSAMTRLPGKQHQDEQLIAFMRHFILT